VLIKVLCIFNTVYILSNILIYLYKKYIGFYLKRNYLKILKFRLKRPSKAKVFKFLDEEPQEEFDESCVKKIEGVRIKEYIQ